ncbi:MAG: hypothetical protein J6X94_01570 [Lachnospiraceae bacterium]|nr:hypothetical protein [Lachnospiraceae bacterium]
MDNIENKEADEKISDTSVEVVNAEKEEENDVPVTILLKGLGILFLAVPLIVVLGILILMFLVMHFA